MAASLDKLLKDWTQITGGCDNSTGCRFLDGLLKTVQARPWMHDVITWTYHLSMASEHSRHQHHPRHEPPLAVIIETCDPPSCQVVAKDVGVPCHAALKPVVDAFGLLSTEGDD